MFPCCDFDDRELTLRSATDTDTPRLTRLAALDSSRLPTGELVLAEVGGELLAAVRVCDGTAIADPFAPTAHLVSVLRAHASGLRARLACADAEPRRVGWTSIRVPGRARQARAVGAR